MRSDLASLPLIESEPPAGSPLPAVFDFSCAELENWFRQHGQPPWRARQVRRWLLVAGAESYSQMTDLPRGLRAELPNQLALFSTAVVRHQEAADHTHKLLLRLRDGNTIESVLIQEDNRRTACISTQVGCGMGCVFCASGLDGVERNLTTGEILEQLLRLRLANKSAIRDPQSAIPRLTHVVVMGMGEPLANLDNLLAALEVATAKDGLGLSARHITISTVGLPAKMRRLAEAGKHYHLAVSLHAPEDELRNRIVPTNLKTGLAEILAAADEFHARTGRQVTYEYVLLRDLNDRPEQARALAKLLRGRGAHLNLIPFNDVEGLPYCRPTTEALTEFVEILRGAGLSVKVRKRKGSEIDAACGQLRRKVMESQGSRQSEVVSRKSGNSHSTPEGEASEPSGSFLPTDD